MFRAQRLSAPSVDRTLAAHECAAAANRSPPTYRQTTPAAVPRVTEGRFNRSHHGIPPAPPGPGSGWSPSAPPVRLRRWRTAAVGCGNGRRDSCAPRRLVRARLLPQTPERAGDPRRVPPCEEAPLRPAAAAAGGGRSWLGRVRNWQRRLQTPPCAGPGARSALSVRHGCGVGLAARGTSDDGAVWSCVRRRPRGGAGQENRTLDVLNSTQAQARARYLALAANACAHRPLSRPALCASWSALGALSPLGLNLR